MVRNGAMPELERALPELMEEFPLSETQQALVKRLIRNRLERDDPDGLESPVSSRFTLTTWSISSQYSFSFTFFDRRSKRSRLERYYYLHFIFDIRHAPVTDMLEGSP